MATKEQALIIDIEAKADQALTELRSVTKQIETLDAEVKRSSKSTRQMQSDFDALGKNANRLAKSLVGVFAGVVSYQGAKEYVRLLGDVEEGFVGIAKTTGLAGEEFETLKEQLYDLSTTMSGVSVAELQGIAETAGQLGITGIENISEFTRVVAEMAVATDLSAEQAANAFAKLGNVLGEPVSEYERMGSVVNELSNNTTALASDIVNVANRMAGMGKTFGLATEDIFGFAAALKDMGLETEVAGSAFSTLLGQILKETEKFAAFTGVSLEKFSNDIKTKPTEAIKTFLTELGKLDSQQQVKALNDLGLSGLRVSETVLKLSANMDTLNKDLSIAREEWAQNTSLQNEYAASSQSLNAQLEKTKNTLIVLGAKIGKSLLPAVKELNTSFQEWVKNLDPKKIEAFGDSLGDMVGSLGSLASILSQINDVLLPDFLSQATNMESTTLFGGVAEGWQKLLDLVSGGGETIGAAFTDFSDKADEAAEATQRLSVGVKQFASDSTKEFENLVRSVKGQIDANQELIDQYGKYEFAREYVAGLRKENEKLLGLFGELSEKRPFSQTAQSAVEAAAAIDGATEAARSFSETTPETAVTVDTSSVDVANEKIQQFRNELTLNGVTLTVDADTTPADFGIDRLVSYRDGTTINIVPNVEYEKAEAEIDAVRQRAERAPIRQEVEADTTKAEIEIEQISKSAKKTVVDVEADTRQADIQIQVLEAPKQTTLGIQPDASAALAAISQLQQPIITHQYIYQHLIPAAAGGGYIDPKRFSVGGRVPGFDPFGSDDVPALLTRGEYVINASAVRFYGDGFFELLNRQLLPKDALNISMPTLSATSVSGGRYSTGGSVDSGLPSRDVNINFNLESGESLSVSADEATAELLENYFRKFA